MTTKKRKHQEKREKRSAPSRPFPTPAERERIIQRRDRLLEELIGVFVGTPPAGHNRAVARLTQTYGLAEVQIVLEAFLKNTQRPLVHEEPGLYREYRLAFARFGGERPFLGKQVHEELVFEHAQLVAKRKWKSLFQRRPSRRQRELRDLLLVDIRFAEDITPPSPPPRPPEFVAPPGGSYPSRLEELLRLGWKADEKVITAKARRAAAWEPFIPDLEHMVLDEGLLYGWPAEPSAWAPLHALRLLGHLRAHRSAGRLLALMDREDDWLSDLLPSVWSDMGPEVAEPLWAYVQDRQHNPEQRGNALVGLQKLAEKHPRYRGEIVERLSRLLDDAPVEDKTANAYIVYVLGELKAVETLPALGRAFDAGKVDLKIMTWGDAMARMERA